jgi:hypothetical protein
MKYIWPKIALVTAVVIVGIVLTVVLTTKESQASAPDESYCGGSQGCAQCADDGAVWIPGDILGKGFCTCGYAPNYKQCYNCCKELTT